MSTKPFIPPEYTNQASDCLLQVKEGTLTLKQDIWVPPYRRRHFGTTILAQEHFSAWGHLDAAIWAPDVSASSHDTAVNRV